MLTKTKTFTMATADRNGIATDTLGAAGNFTIDGALATAGVATMDVARHVSLYAASDNSARTITVTGTDRHGNVITDAITGPTAGATVHSVKNFKTVTQVAIDDASTGDIEVGSSDECETQWIPVDAHKQQTSISVLLSSSASLKHSGVFTLQNVMDKANQEDAVETHVLYADPSGEYEMTKIGSMAAFRLKIFDFTSGTITMTYAQA